MKVGPKEGCICMNHAMSIALCLYVQWSGQLSMGHTRQTCWLLKTKRKSRKIVILDINKS
jgi:hypothetical protein